MTLFNNPTHFAIWREKWCDTCFQTDEAMRRIQGKNTCCPILASALRTNRKPKEWDRNPRAQVMADTIKCNAYESRPAAQRRRGEQKFEDVPLFDIEPHQAGFVPVDNWPDKPRADGVDHA